MISQRQLFLDHLAQTTDFPLMLEIEKAEGIYLYDTHGKRYIDFISGIAVSNVGHRHPEVIEAIHKQLEKYMHLMVYGEYVQTPQVQLAKLLTDNLSSSLNCCYFLNSGSEAVEGAIKLAKRYTGRTELISCYNAYHGSTHGALSLMGNEVFKNSYRPLLPDTKRINYNSLENLEQITSRTACVVVETIQGEAGVVVPERNYLNKLQQKCRETGALLVVDEIQCGFGRTGSLFAFEEYEITPDILILAKGMGGGMPIGAFISSREIMGALKTNPLLGHITTFGGHPVSCAASYATLQVILKNNFHKISKEKGELIKQLLVHPAIKEVRGKGLMLGVQFESFEINKKIIDQCIKDGVITDWFLFNDSTMRIAPPLTITEEEIKENVEIILGSIEKATQ